VVVRAGEDWELVVSEQAPVVAARAQVRVAVAGQEAAEGQRDRVLAGVSEAEEQVLAQEEPVAVQVGERELAVG